MPLHAYAMFIANMCVRRSARMLGIYKMTISGQLGKLRESPIYAWPCSENPYIYAVCVTNNLIYDAAYEGKKTINTCLLYCDYID